MSQTIVSTGTLEIKVGDNSQYDEYQSHLGFVSPYVKFTFTCQNTNESIVLHGHLLPSDKKQGWEITCTPHRSATEIDLFFLLHEMLRLKTNEKVLKEEVTEQAQQVRDKEKLSVPASLLFAWLSGDHAAGEALSDWLEESGNCVKAHNLRILLEWWRWKWGQGTLKEDWDKIINGDPDASKPQGTIQA